MEQGSRDRTPLRNGKPMVPREERSDSTGGLQAHTQAAVDKSIGRCSYGMRSTQYQKVRDREVATVGPKEGPGTHLPEKSVGRSLQDPRRTQPC